MPSLLTPSFASELGQVAGVAFDRQEIVALGTAATILGFSVLSAILLMRTRTRAAENESRLRAEILALQAENDRSAALLLTEPDERARAVGAANTLWYDGEILRSTNTDIEGFINNLDACAPGLNAADEAVVLGAGGSSRAVVFGLLERGLKRVHLVNRTVGRARALADQFGARVSPRDWEALGELLPCAQLLVNTTSLGMKGQPALEIDVGLLPPQATVADLVYVPLDTPLLAAARARDLPTADGLGMLLHQAVRGFELWFGRRPEVTPELRRLVEADLAAAR